MAKQKSGSRKFAAAHSEELKEFFAEVQIACASGAVKTSTTDDGVFTTMYHHGPWCCHDVQCGGEPFSGMAMFYHEDVVCFCFHYSGRIMPFAEHDEVMQCLAQALQKANPKRPWRGPREYIAESGLIYRNTLISERGIRRFSGRESIVSADGEETLYEASYSGIVVNKD